MEQERRLRNTGFLAYFFSGICAISSGILISILQEKYGLSFRVTGNLVSMMSVGNMLAAFLTGVLSVKVGLRSTVLIMGSGYFLGYYLMTLTGNTILLLCAFLMAGLAKGCALNSCTVLVGNNSEDRARGMSIMHSAYAFGALLCPFLVAILARGSIDLPIKGIALVGLVMWVSFLVAKLPGKERRDNAEKRKAQMHFLREKKFWLLTALVFCENAAGTSVTGWVVTYYKNQGILSGALSNYTVTILWGATLLARLLIAFVFPIRKTFHALLKMGVFCSIFYSIMIFVDQPIQAVLMLFVFAFSIAGVNPMTVAGMGRETSSASMGVMLPVGGIGAILMPSITGFVADEVGLKMGMLCNLAPCIGIIMLSIVMLREQKA